MNWKKYNFNYCLTLITMYNLITALNSKYSFNICYSKIINYTHVVICCIGFEMKSIGGNDWSAVTTCFTTARIRIICIFQLQTLYMKKPPFLFHVFICCRYSTSTLAFPFQPNIKYSRQWSDWFPLPGFPFRIFRAKMLSFSQKLMHEQPFNFL